MLECEVAIVGGGPAGLTAAMYLSRAATNVKLFRTISPPSQIIMTPLLENYPGISKVDGFGFIETMTGQAAKFGAEIVEKNVVKLQRQETRFVLTLEDDEIAASDAVIIASGNRAKMLDIPGEREFVGHGVSYCATCDGALFRGKDVVVTGGGDTAAEDGYFLSRLAKKVYLVHRRHKMRANQTLADRFLTQKNVEAVWESTIVSINGGKLVESVTVKHVHTGMTREIKVNGVFVFVGGEPNTKMVKGLVDMDEDGYILTDERMRTNVPGFFAAGDCRHKDWRQVITACADGAEAAYSAQKFIETLHGRAYPGRSGS